MQNQYPLQIGLKGGKWSNNLGIFGNPYKQGVLVPSVRLEASNSVMMSLDNRVSTFASISFL